MAKQLNIPQIQQERAKTKSPLYSMTHRNKSSETIRTCFIFDKELYGKVKVYAAQKETTVTDLIKSYFESLVSKDSIDA